MQIIILIIYLLLYTCILALDILNIIASWIIFKKAGRKGWESLIPLYNFWILITKIVKLNWWWILIYLSPILIIFLLIFNTQNIAIILITVILCYIGCYLSTFVCYYNIAKKFNHKTIDAVAMLLIPNIMFPIIAFSKNWIYDENIIVSKNGPFKD